MTWLYWTLAILFGLLLAALSYRKDRHADIPVRWLPAGLRALTGTLTALLILAPAFPGKSHTEERPHILWLQDISSSTRHALSQYKDSFQIKEQKILRQLQDQYTVSIYGFGSQLQKDSIYSYPQPYTNIADALSQAAEQHQDKNIGAIVIATDGIYNQGAHPLFVQLPRPIPIYTIALGDSSTPIDARVTAIHANKTVTLNSNFELFADVEISGLAQEHTTVRLMQQGKTIATRELNINSNQYSSSISFSVTAQPKGLQQFTVSIAPTGTETNLQNNTLSTIIDITERKGRILLLAAAPHPDLSLIHHTLQSTGQYVVDLITDGKVPAQTEVYQAVIAYQYYPATGLSNLPAWYILGPESNPAQLQKIQQLSGSGNTGSGDLTARLNDPFNIYTLPPAIRQRLPKMPPLNGPGLLLKPSGNSLLTQTNGRVLWQYHQGQPSYSILAGAGLWRWGLYEYKNFNDRQMTEELIRQTVNFLQADQNKKPFTLVVPKTQLTNNEPLIVLAELHNPNGTLTNVPEATLRIEGNGKTLTYALEKAGNSYRADAGLLAAGDYRITAQITFNGKTYEDYARCYIADIPLESLRTQADFPLLYQLSSDHQGHFFTQYNFEALPDSLKRQPAIRTRIHSKQEARPLIDYKWLFFLILLFAASEWFLRKYWGMHA